MLRQILLGGGINIINIAIHALLMTTVIRVAQRVDERSRSRSALLLVAVLMPTVSVLMIIHTLEVFVWASAYSLVDVAPAESFGDLVYFAFVNYTTLGYGDIIPTPRWRLLGPMTAMNGVLLFGWSTAVIFEVLRKTLERLEISRGVRAR
jgi:Na+/H+ antiporter NhaC